MIKEEWREVFEREDYEVSNKGRVRSNKFGKSRIMKPSVDKDGYFRLSLSKDDKLIYRRINRLVLTAFIRHPFEGEQGCHNDGDRKNNNLTNLRWDTSKGNQHDKAVHGTDSVGIRNGRSKLTENEVRSIMAIRKTWNFSMKKISKMFCVSEGSISNICTGKTYKNVTKGALSYG